MADDIDDIREFVGREHFPTCHCFSQPGSACPDEMYMIAQQASDQLMADAIRAGFCREAFPFLVAMATDMMVSTIGSMMMTQDHGADVTPETSMLYAEKCRQIHEIVRVKLEALERRGAANCVRYTGGSASVQ